MEDETQIDPIDQSQMPLYPQIATQSKRKEKARIAARVRRGQEASLILDMATELDISQEKLKRVDKATIVKLAIDYIKAFKILCQLEFDNVGVDTLEAVDKQDDNSKPSQIHHNHKRNHTSIQRQNKKQQQEYHLESKLHNHHHHQNCRHEPEQQHQQEKLLEPCKETTIITPYSAPQLTTKSIFAPKTAEMSSHFLVINSDCNGESSLILKPDTEILDEEDLTHLAPQAGRLNISLDADSLDGIVLDTSLFSSSPPPILKGISG